MTREDLIKITGQHLLFLGIPAYSWSIAQFQEAAKFARAHDVQTLFVKTHDGTLPWYQDIGGWHAVRQTILNEGVGAIPYTYSYGNKLGALDAEIDILIAHMQDSGIVCMDAEEEWNGQPSWAQHLCSRVQGQSGVFLVSTWADPSLQNWLGVIRALAPCVDVWMPQQYSNFLATCWTEFGINGVDWLQPTINLTQDFGPNNPVQIATDAAGQGHTAISVWYCDTAVANPGLLDQVYAAFPKENSVKTYGPNSSDFNSYFTENSDGSWTCRQTGASIIGDNLKLYCQLSIDGQTLPIIGLPREGEQYLSDHHSIQRFERAVLTWNPDDPTDQQPGLGPSHLAFINMPDTLREDLGQLAILNNSTQNAWQALMAKIYLDANLPSS